MSFSNELFPLALDYASSPLLAELKKRFTDFDHCHDKATAAAFGYLAALREKEEEECPDSIFDKLCEVMDDVGGHKICSEEATEMVMGIIYQWLHISMGKEGFVAMTDYLTDKFSIYLKPNDIL